MSNYVIAIASVSGGGKTTLVNQLAQQLQGTTLFFDDYAKASAYPKGSQTDWIKNGADVNEFNTPQLALDLADLKNGQTIVSPKTGDSIAPSPYIVVEEPMGRERIVMSPHIDFVVAIDTDMEIALARRVLRDLQKIDHRLQQKPKEEKLPYAFQGISYIKGFLTEYLESGRDFFQVIQQKVLANCDLVIDGKLPVEEAAQQVIKAVKKIQ